MVFIAEFDYSLFSGSGSGADPDMRNYGMYIAAMSQYADMQGVINSSDFINNMMDDAFVMTA